MGKRNKRSFKFTVDDGEHSKELDEKDNIKFNGGNDNDADNDDDRDDIEKTGENFSFIKNDELALNLNDNSDHDEEQDGDVDDEYCDNTGNERDISKKRYEFIPLSKSGLDKICNKLLYKNKSRAINVIGFKERMLTRKGVKRQKTEEIISNQIKRTSRLN